MGIIGGSNFVLPVLCNFFVCYVTIIIVGFNFVFVNWLNWLLAGPILCCHAPSEGCVRGRNCEAGS